MSTGVAEMEGEGLCQNQPATRERWLKLDGFERVVLFIGALVLIYQIAIPPIVGVFDNGDFFHVMWPAGFRHVSEKPEDMNVFVNSKFLFEKPGLLKTHYISSETLIARLARVIGRILSKDGLFDIRVLGLMHAALLLLGIALIISAHKKLRTPSRRVLALLLVWIFTDVGYVAFFNSFYSQTASPLFLILTAGFFALLVGNEDKKWTYFAGFVLAALLFISSKPQEAPQGVLLAIIVFLAARALRPRWAKTVGVVLVAVVLGFATICYVAGPTGVKNNSLYNAVFEDLLKNSPDPAADLAELKLSNDLLKYVGTHAFIKDSPVPQDWFKAAFYQKVRHEDLLVFYMKHPSRFWSLITRRSAKAFTLVTHYGNFEKRSGFPSGTKSSAFKMWSDFKEKVFPGSPWTLMVLFFGNIAAVALLLIRDQKSNSSHLGLSAFGILNLMAIGAFLIPTLGDGTLDIVRQLYTFNTMTDLCLIGDVVFLIEAVTRKIQKSMLHSLYAKSVGDVRRNAEVYRVQSNLPSERPQDFLFHEQLMKVTSKFKIFKSPIRFSFSKEQYVDIAFLLGVSAAFLSLSFYQIKLPGLYGDELDKLVPTVNLLTGQPFSGVGWYKTFFGFRILLSFTDRIGPVLSYLPMPFILLFGYTPFALRFSSIFCAWLTLIFAYFGAKIWFGPSVARYGIAITAVSPVFVFLQRMGYYNYGPVTLFTSLTFFFLARYISKRNSYDLWAGAAFAGIAINTALQAIFVLIPMVLIGLLFWDTIRPRLREVVVALIIFLIVGSPIIGMTLKSGGALERIGWSGSNPGSLTLSGFVDTLSEEIHHFKGMLGGLDGVQVGSIGKDIRNPMMSYVFGLSIVTLSIFFFFVRDKKDFIRRNAGSLLITLFGLFLTGFLLKDRASYQLIVFWPFAILVVGAGLAQISQRISLVSIAIACVLVILQAKATVEAHQILSQIGGRIVTSSQIYPLANYFSQRRELHPIAMEWGLLNQIYYLTGGKVLPESIHGWWPKDGVPPDEFKIAVLNRLEKENNVFIFFGPGKGFDRYFHFQQLAKASNKNVYPEKIFYENDGSIAYRLYRVSKSDKVISPKDECFESVPSGRWKGEYFTNKTLSSPPVRVRDDGDGFINFNWGGGSPDSACGMGSDNFSVRWTRKIYFKRGTYRLTVTSDDGFRLFVDNRLMLDKWFDQGPTPYTADLLLSAGDHTIKMEYYQATGQAVASLSWKMK